MNSPLRLSSDAFSRAANFLHQARPLERALFAFHFESGPAESVRQEIAPFQNPDGGFHSQEPDLTFTHSSVLSTCHALHTLAAVGTPTNHPRVQRALDYLVATFDRETQVWPIIPAHDNSTPHAPWWHCSPEFAANFGHFVDNPRPDVLACLHHFADPKTAALRKGVDPVVAHRIESSAKMEMQGTVCYSRLSVARDLPAALARALQHRMPEWIDQNVVRDPARWGDYVLRPLDVAPAADSPWRAHLGSAIDDNLDYLIKTQNEDGSWSPH